MPDDTTIALAMNHQWIPLAALVIGLVVRVLKDDTRVLPTVPSKYRRPLAFALGLAAGALQMVAAGTSWKDALATAVVAPLLAIGGHHIGIDLLRGGREIPVPGLMKPKAPPQPPAA